MDVTFQNEESNYGVQAGQIHGGVVSTPGSSGTTVKISAARVAEELQALRIMLDTADRDGRLPAALAPAARAGLGVADSVAAESDPPHRGRLMQALEVVRASVVGVSGLSEAVVSLISTLSGAR